MSECKHGLKTGCSYCHETKTPPPRQLRKRTRSSPASRLSDQMNERMTLLKRRLREIRGE